MQKPSWLLMEVLLTTKTQFNGNGHQFSQDTAAQTTFSELAEASPGHLLAMLYSLWAEQLTAVKN